MAKEFHYFNINAIAESVRYILYYTKQDFKDVRHDIKTWPVKEIKDTLAFGQFPLYKEGDRVLNQSLAIAKYVARGTDLIPTDPWEQAVLENIALTIYDYWAQVRVYISEKDLDKKVDLKKELLETKIPFYFSRFEQRLNDNGGFFGRKLSWAEFVLVGLTESTNLFLGIEAQSNYPRVEAVIDTIRNLPGVKEHIAARGPYKLPFSTKEHKGVSILIYP